MKRSFFLKPFSWPVSQPFPTNSCCGRATGALYCSSETGRRAGGWSEMQKCLRSLLPPGTGRCRAAALRSASSLAHTHGRTLGKLLGIPASQYLDFLHRVTDGYPTWWRSEWHMKCSLGICVVYAILHMHALTNIHAHTIPFLWTFFVSEIGLQPEANRTTSLGILCSC